MTLCHCHYFGAAVSCNLLDHPDSYNYNNHNEKDCQSYLQVTFDRYGTLEDHPPTITWSLEGPWPMCIQGVIDSNETTATTCIPPAKDFDCAELRGRILTDSQIQMEEHGRLTVVWNGVVWANQPYHLKSPSYDPPPLLYLGENCWAGRVCQARPHSSLLDVQLTTATSETNSSAFGSNHDRGIEESVFWRVYAGFRGSRGVYLDDPYFPNYAANTTYRTLQCVPRAGMMCMQLGLKRFSQLTNLTIRMNGKLREKRWECSEGLCEGDIVTPLRGCPGDVAQTIAIPVILAVFVAFVAWYYYYKKHRERSRCRSEDRVSVRYFPEEEPASEMVAIASTLVMDVTHPPSALSL